MSSDNLMAAPRTADEFAEELERFPRTRKGYTCACGDLSYTQGVFHLAFRSEGVLYDDEHACTGAYWLLRDIAQRQYEARERCGGFQLWTLTIEERGPMRGAILTCRGDANQPPVITVRMAWTDFPITHLKLYVLEEPLAPSQRVLIAGLSLVIPNSTSHMRGMNNSARTSDATEFVTNRQWDAYASRVFNANIKRASHSLSPAGISRRAQAHIVEVRDGGMVVKAGWREAMKREEESAAADLPAAISERYPWTDFPLAN